jgi:hypothetical protein
MSWRSRRIARALAGFVDAAGHLGNIFFAGDDFGSRLMGLAFDVGFGGLALVVERVEVLSGDSEHLRGKRLGHNLTRDVLVGEQDQGLVRRGPCS